MKARSALPVLVSLFLCTPLWGGTLRILSGNYIGTTTTQTFPLTTQVFPGSTTCGSVGGPINAVGGVDSTTGYSLNVSASDSVMLTVDPASVQAHADQNGPFVSWGTAVEHHSTITFLPGDGRNVCVAGFDGPGVRDYTARFYAGILTYDLCGNLRSHFAPGETMEIRVSGGLTFNPEQHRLLAAGGSVNECTFLPEGPDFTTVYITGDPWSYTFTLPATDAEILPSCIGSGTTSILGNWRIVAYDPSCGCNRTQYNFTVAADAPPPPPCTIDCPDDISVSNDAGACGANVSYATPAGATCTQASGSFFPVGTTTVTCTSGALSCDFDVTVTDDEAPTASATASPNVLWPPNHKMMDVTVTASSTDNCATPACTITSVASNEPTNGLGDGDTAPDFEIVDPTHVRLRAERSAAGSGRTYTVGVTCGSATANVPVTVPKK